MPAILHLTIFVEVVGLAIDLLICIGNFFTFVVEVVPMLAAVFRIIFILISHGLFPLVGQHMTIFSYIVVIIYPCICLHLTIFVKMEPFAAIFLPLVGYHLIIAVIVVPNSSVIFLPTSCERSHGSTHSE